MVASLNKFIGGLFISCLALTSLMAQEITVHNPESAGFSSQRLERIQPLMQEYIDSGRLAGINTLIAREGNVIYLDSQGYRDIDKQEPMTEDTIFRIYSMTKPISTVAALILYEKGAFLLSDPVSEYIPEFKDVQVYDQDAPDGTKRTPVDRQITIKDLMTHTSGLTYGLFSQTPVDTLYRESGLFGENVQSLEDMMNKLVTLPLLHQPGETWHYSVSTDVLGYLVQVVSGQPLADFFCQHIFQPLEMNDTAFEVKNRDLSRFAVNYSRDEDGKLIPVDGGRSSDFAAPVTMHSGGGGLVSTLADYLKFSQMLLNGGELNGTRILSPKSVDLMTQNHLQGERSPGWGFGLGVQVCLNVPRTGSLGTQGMYGWSGAAKTFFFIDPEEELIAMVWTQLFGDTDMANKFKVAVYQAMIQ